MKRILIALVAAISALNAASVLASATYSFDCSKTDCSNPNTSLWGNTRTQTLVESVSGKTIKVTATAVANTNGSNSSANGSSQKIETAYLAAYGHTLNQAADSDGLGVRNRDATSSDVDTAESGTPEHAIDNNERYDMVLLTFDSAVTLSQIKLGFVDTDSDVSILAYGGATSAASPAALTGLTYDKLVSNGWLIVGSYSNVGENNDKTVNTGNIASTTWLVGAYNPLTGDNSCSSCTVGNDYFKLLTFSIKDQSPTTTTQVPEPGSIALVGLALAGIAASRRRKK